MFQKRPCCPPAPAQTAKLLLNRLPPCFPLSSLDTVAQSFNVRMWVQLKWFLKCPDPLASLKVEHFAGDCAPTAAPIKRWLFGAGKHLRTETKPLTLPALPAG